MDNAQLVLANRDVQLSVRSFSVHDGLSCLFDVWVTAGSGDADLDFEAIVGHAAVFRLATGDAERPHVVWSGLCNDIEQVSVEPDGMSIYALRIVPWLWRTTQRRNHRVFQHVSATDVVVALAGEWEIEIDLRLGAVELPVGEYRVQYGETDFAFLSRLLEDAGVWYWFEQAPPRSAGGIERMVLVLSDDPVSHGHRLTRPIAYRGHTDEHDALPYVSKVRFGRALRPGHLTIGGRDYRLSPDLQLLAEARAGAEHEQQCELYQFIPGAFLVEPTSAKDGAGEATASAQAGERAAMLDLERVRSRARRVTLNTNVLELGPAAIFTVEGHPRADLDKRDGLLAVERTLDGEVSLDWQARVLAVLSSERQRPQRITPRPRVMGVHSAVVVGPEGEEIHVDALGRVRVQFFWDRYGQRDEHASCWVRVSQGWAGGGYGLSCLPRVGHEVLVGFYQGNPDAPVIVGGAHHRGATPPQLLPKERSSSMWRSQSTPGGDGFNEIRMEDAAGAERLLLRAQRNLDKVVLADESATVGGKLVRSVTGDEQRQVGGDQSIAVEGDRDVSASGHCSTSADGGLQLQAGETTGMSCAQGKVVISNGSASIVLDGPNVVINSAANLRLAAGGLLGLCGKQVSVDGGPEVLINSEQAVAPAVAALPAAGSARAAATPQDSGELGESPERQGGPQQAVPSGADEAELAAQALYQQLGHGGQDPPARVRLPAAINAQLARQARLAGDAGMVSAPLMAPEQYRVARDGVARGLAEDQARLQRLNDDLRGSFAAHRGDHQALAKSLAQRLAHERDGADKRAASRRKLLAAAAVLGGGLGTNARQLGAGQDDLRAALRHQRNSLAVDSQPAGAPGAEIRDHLDSFDAMLQAGGAGAPPRPGDEAPSLAEALGESSADAGAGMALSRDGGLAAKDVASTVDGGGPSFLQSPAEGQIMAVPTAKTRPIDAAALQHKLVDAQMDGEPVDRAITGALHDSGYAVYQRPAGDFTGEMVRAAG